MSGETDLSKMLASRDGARRPGRFAYVTGHHPELGDVAVAMIAELEGTTLVVPAEEARGAGIDVGFEAAWLTLTVFSALEAVGLTAAFSAALGAVGIPCNVLAGYHHDHLLVPVDRVDEAIQALRALAEISSS